jgi:TonB dependent receptor/CarboxypepD_reg-like domain/TonB-dependent Receptor Plug Domain
MNWNMKNFMYVLAMNGAPPTLQSGQAQRSATGVTTAGNIKKQAPLFETAFLKGGVLTLLFFLVFFVTGIAQTIGNINGAVVDKNTQKPLLGANLQLLPGNRATATDSIGYFRLTGIPVGTYNLTASLIGYKAVTLYNIVLGSGNENSYTIELEPVAIVQEAVSVRANRRSARAATLETPLSVQRLTAEEIRSNPGGNFDISKVIQTLPGVGGGAGGGTFRNDIIIRGGAPNENVFYLDGIEVPVINHFQTQGSSGGPQGILNVSFIEDVKLNSSAFDARYDNAMSSVFQFKQKNGNASRTQGNIRLSASEIAATLEGPLSKKKKATFLASARRSYLQLLFKAIDLPIRPNYWDFQVKATYPIDKKTTLTFLGIGAIDEFSFVAPKESTPEKLYVINSSPGVNQWNYTVGVSLKKLLDNGFWNLSLSQTNLNNTVEKFEDNQTRVASERILDITSRETETKLRFDVTKNVNGWKLAYGTGVQVADYNNKTFTVIKKEIRDAANNIIQPAVTVNFESPLKPFARLGAFVQAGKRFANNRLGLSAGMRTDMNTFTTNGLNGLQTISPRVSLSYTLRDNWTLNASAGRYFKLPPYTILGFADNNNVLVNKNTKYLAGNHYTGGVEYLPNEGLRITLEGFYKQYSNVPVSVRNGISLSNLGADFSVLGNEAVTANGKGKAYGAEFFAQKKLTKRIFGIVSYTWYRSLYSGLNGKMISSTWDNQHLLSLTSGYKFKRNWELGLKFRYQGGAPYTPIDETLSRLNYLSQGTGTLNYALLNSQRLGGFNSSDIRIDKKWNFKKFTLDVYLDITNWYMAKNPATPEYTFERTADNKGFKTTDGLPIRTDGSNAIPTRVKNDDVVFLPTVGFVVEF